MVVDRLTESAYFIPITSNYSVEDYARFYIDKIVTFHGVSFPIISNRSAQLTSTLWRYFQKGFGTQINLSIAIHPQTDGVAERTF